MGVGGEGLLPTVACTGCFCPKGKSLSNSGV